MKILIKTDQTSIFRLIALLTILTGFQLTTASAQTAGFEAGLAGQMSNVLGTGIISNSVSANATASAKRAEANRIKAIELRGAQIIKAGKATTRFVPNAATTRMTLKNLTFSANEPQDLAGQIRWVQNYTNKLNELAKAAGLPINDYSDGYVLAVALSRAAYYDKKFSIKDLQPELEKNRQRILTSNYAQGMSNETKQIQYELYADMTIQALEFREQARQAKTPQEKAEADQKAKRYAEYMIGSQ